MTGSMPPQRPAETGLLNFEDFFAQFAREGAAIVAVSTGDRQLAEDVTQEAMARAFVNWARVSRMDRPDLWVLHVARRLAIDAWRKKRREARLGATTAADAAADRAIRDFWIRWDLEQLTPSDRFLVLLRHRDGLSLDEIAARTGKARNTVSIYLKRARRRLRAVRSEGDS